MKSVFILSSILLSQSVQAKTFTPFMKMQGGTYLGSTQFQLNEFYHDPRLMYKNETFPICTTFNREEVLKMFCANPAKPFAMVHLKEMGGMFSGRLARTKGVNIRTDKSSIVADCYQDLYFDYIECVSNARDTSW